MWEQCKGRGVSNGLQGHSRTFAPGFLSHYRSTVEFVLLMVLRSSKPTTFVYRVTENFVLSVVWCTKPRATSLHRSVHFTSQGSKTRVDEHDLGHIHELWLTEESERYNLQSMGSVPFRTLCFIVMNSYALKRIHTLWTTRWTFYQCTIPKSSITLFLLTFMYKGS